MWQVRALCLHLTVLAGQVALISDRPRRGDTRHIVFAPERTQAHAETGRCGSVDRSLSLLGGDVFCLAAAGHFTPTVDPSGMGKVQGPSLRERARQGLVGSSTSARAKFPSLRRVHEQASRSAPQR